MPVTIDDLKRKIVEVHEHNESIVAGASAENRQLSVSEQEELDRGNEEFRQLDRQIKQRQEVEEQRAALSRSSRASEPAEPTTNWGTIADDAVITVKPGNKNMSDRRNTDLARNPHDLALRRDGGFTRGAGDFWRAVYEARLGGSIDPRLQRLAATTYGNETSGAEGGFAVPIDFRASIMQKVFGEGSLLQFCDQQPISGNTLTVPKDEQTPWDTSGAIRAQWAGEADTYTQRKPDLAELTVRANKLACLVPMTDELLEDAPAMNSWIQRKVPACFTSTINLAILQGSGAGQPAGILNSSHTVSVAKEGTPAQVADTIVYPNIVKMYSRLFAPWRNGAIWIYNQDIEPQLLQLSHIIYNGTTPVGGSLVYTPGNTIAGQPYDTLFGKRTLATQACETLGDKGDIFFAAMDQYLVVLKAAGMQFDTSIHVWFDQSVTAFRFVMRIGGQPWWQTTISPRDGTTTYSAFVTLDERA